MAEVFVAIPAYDDWGVVGTVCSLLQDPGLNLRIGVVLQTDDAKLVKAMRGMPRVDTLHVPKGAARGLGWARALAQTLYEGEPWTAQFDAHMSDFDPQWARTLATQSEQVGGKPILTARPIAQDYQGSPGACIMSPKDFNDFGLGFSASIWRLEEFHGSPVPSRSVAGALLWAPGSFIERVPADPRIYFREEFALSVRAWTSGYDLWHPAAAVCRHDYSGNPRPWEHDPEWSKRYEATKVRLARLYAGENLGAYGLGTVRSLAEFEAWSGIDLKARTATPDSEWRDSKTPVAP